jgi:tetratricopeptide (TPR) repeat protein
LKKTIKLAPNYVEAYHGKAVALYQLSKYEEAITSESKAIQINPNYGQAWYSRGLAYSKINQKENACNDFRAALNLGQQDAIKMLDEYCK